MPLETLNEQQKAFIGQYLSKSFFKKSANKQTVNDYEAYLAQEGMFKELATALPREDPRTVAILKDLKPVMDNKNTGKFGPATDGMVELVRRGQDLKNILTQEKAPVQQRLDRAVLPNWLSGDALQQATELRQGVTTALEPELVAGAVLDKAKLDLNTLDEVLRQAEAVQLQVVRERDDLKLQLNTVTLPPWLPTDKAQELTSLRQKVTTALAVEPPTREGVDTAKVDLDGMPAKISQAEQAVRNLKQEKLSAISGMVTPTFMPQPVQGELATLRNTATEAMKDDLPLPAQFTAATDAISQFNSKVQAEKDKIAQRKRPLTEALPGLATPTWAGPEATQAMNGFRQEATNALTDEFPPPEKLLAAETAIAKLRKALEDETARVTKQKEALTRRLAPLTDPPGATPEDLRALAEERQKATAALTPEFPLPADMKKAETAIGALEGLVKQVKQIGGVAGKYGATSDVATQTKGAFKKFRDVLGNVEVNDKLIADSKQAVKDKQDELAAKLQAYHNAQAMPEGNEQQRRAKQQAVERTGNEYWEVDAQKTAAEAYLKAALGQKNLTDALAGGPLSGNSDQKFKPDTAATLIKGFTENPALAKTATDAATTARDPDAIAAGWPTVRDAVSGGMASSTGRAYTDTDYADWYGGQLLKAGGNAGAKYFDRLPDFLASGAQFDPSPFGPIQPTWNEVTGARTKELAGKLMKDDGTIDLDTPEAKKIIGQSLYGRDVMGTPTPDLTKHILKTLDELRDPQASQVMKGITAPPTNPGAQGLIKTSLGKSGTDTIDVKDTRQAIMKSMLTPLSQGSVGSCFATAPVRKMRENQPIDALKAYTEIATKGTFKPTGATDPVPIVTNLPPKEDPISRSLEFTLASSTAVETTSRESNAFSSNMKAGIGQFEPMAGGASSEWPRKKAAVTSAISNAFTFVYDPTADVKGSNDGSSSKGHYVLTLKNGNKPITTKDEFSEAVAEIAIASFGVGGGSDEATRIKTLTKQDAFINAVCPGTYKPWDLAGGGFGDQATKSLFGSGLTVKNLMPQSSGSPAPTEGERTTKLATDMINKFRGKTDQMIVVNTNGIHSFNALPNDPSLAPLKGATDTETAQKVQTNLVDKGQALKNTDLTAERAQYLFDQELNKAIKAEKAKGGTSNPDWVQLLEDGVKTKRPTAAMKPAALNQAIKDALKPYQDAAATKEADDWKGKEETATPPRPVTPDKLLEKVNALKKAKAEASENAAKSNMIRDMAAPQFVIADTNWGSGLDHTFFVIAPDPTTGEPMLWKKTEPPGSMAPMEKKWLDTRWESVD
jgi:hypothetical protein